MSRALPWEDTLPFPRRVSHDIVATHIRVYGMRSRPAFDGHDDNRKIRMFACRPLGIADKGSEIESSIPHGQGFASDYAIFCNLYRRLIAVLASLRRIVCEGEAELRADGYHSALDRVSFC